MAVRVVHRLEAVHVAEQQDEGLAVRTPARERLVEDARVQDVGEEVALREVAELHDVKVTKRIAVAYVRTSRVGSLGVATIASAYNAAARAPPQKPIRVPQES